MDLQYSRASNTLRYPGGFTVCETKTSEYEALNDMDSSVMKHIYITVSLIMHEPLCFPLKN